MRNTNVLLTGAGFAFEKMGSPVFVVGPARSGTTTVAHFLASELCLACSPETNVLAILKRTDALEMTFKEFCVRQDEFLMHGKQRPYSILFPAELMSKKISENMRAIADLIISMDSYCQGERMLEQTPRNGEHLGLLREIYPDALIVFVVRNPFDVMQSRLQTPWGTKSRLVLFCNWALQYIELLVLCEKVGRSRLILVRYSKLESATYRSHICLSLIHI